MKDINIREVTQTKQDILKGKFTGETPMINGYKLLRHSANSYSSKRKFQVPDTPLREEIAHDLARQSEKKREIKS